jgi:hypothetical protein
MEQMDFHNIWSILSFQTRMTKNTLNAGLASIYLICQAWWWRNGLATPSRTRKGWKKTGLDLDLSMVQDTVKHEMLGNQGRSFGPFKQQLSQNGLLQGNAALYGQTMIRSSPCHVENFSSWRRVLWGASTDSTCDTASGKARCLTGAIYAAQQ